MGFLNDLLLAVHEDRELCEEAGSHVETNPHPACPACVEAYPQHFTRITIRDLKVVDVQNEADARAKDKEAANHEPQEEPEEDRHAEPGAQR